ncbi:MAG: hypothetical protein JNN00_09925 [Chitinophagaceae bacterium]|nr:hypothetical protein [Chitinophagaceae bacterium]
MLSIFCCVLYMRSVSQVSADIRVVSPRTSGERVLVKALTAIVNRHGQKKRPARKIDLPSSESPWM